MTGDEHGTYDPTEYLTPAEQAHRRARALACKNKLKHRFKAREERRHAPSKPIPLPPVYDDVWVKGVRRLDEEID